MPRFHQPIRLHTLVLWICLSFTISSLGAVETTSVSDQLPDIGDPASADLSRNQEIELGKVLLGQINQRLPIATDPELRAYIRSLGSRIISGGLNSDFPFHFMLVFDRRINAFAMPGGIVAINSGLITLAESESELASVVAHEIAHVSQRHIARAFTQQKSASVVTALAMLASILAAAYSADAGTAALYSTLGAQQQSQLAFSRDFEREADRIGMQLLAGANLDPYGMPRFFERLNRHTKTNQGNIPEFLLSHPLTVFRISDSKARAASYEGKYIESTFLFEYAKARIIGLSNDPQRLIEQYETRIKKSPNNIDRYVLAIALARKEKNSEALKVLDQTRPNGSESFSINMLRAQIHLEANRPKLAVPILERLERLYPENEAVIFYLARAYNDTGRSKLALNRLDALPTLIDTNPAIEKLRAKVAEKAGLLWRSHESLSDYYALHGQYGTAMEQLIIASRQKGIDLYSQARIESKQERLKELKEEQEKK